MTQHSDWPSSTDGDQGEVEAVWSEIESNNDGNQTVIFAVVTPEDRGAMEQLVQRMKCRGTLGTFDR
jgi:hypothetical protein